MLETPVGLFIFNRPDTTALVLERLAELRPRRLFVVADGPRPERPAEARLCQQTRELVSRIDWPVELLTNFSAENLGCGRRVSSGLSWIFSQAEEAIILEDDCLPSRGFFPFCESLLEYHRDNHRIGIISGNNFVSPRLRAKTSYYFTRYPHIWGWASWRRTWSLYDFEMCDLDRFLSSGKLAQLFPHSRDVAFWTETFKTVQSGALDTWDFQLAFACFRHELLNIVPDRNLVQNIGFTPDATHTHTSSDVARCVAVGEEPPWPIVHPERLETWRAADALVQETQFRPPRPPFRKRLRRTLKRLFKAHHEIAGGARDRHA